MDKQLQSQLEATTQRADNKTVWLNRLKIDGYSFSAWRKSMAEVAEAQEQE